MPTDWGAIISAGAQIGGAAAAARAKGRADEAGVNNSRDNTANSLFNTAQNAQMNAGQLDLQRQQFAEQAASSRAKQATVGDLLSRLQDVSINVPGIKTAQISGGLRPSAMGETGRLSNALLAKQALMKQLDGDTFTGGQILTPPTQSALPQANAMDGILGALGTYGSIAGGVMGAMGKNSGPMSETPNGGQSYVPSAGQPLAGLDPELLKALGVPMPGQEYL